MFTLKSNVSEEEKDIDRELFFREVSSRMQSVPFQGTRQLRSTYYIYKKNKYIARKTNQSGAKFATGSHLHILLNNDLGEH